MMRTRWFVKSSGSTLTVSYRSASAAPSIGGTYSWDTPVATTTRRAVRVSSPVSTVNRSPSRAIRVTRVSYLTRRPRAKSAR